jgi:hypothetical protein
MSILGSVTANNAQLAQHTCDHDPSRLWYPEYFDYGFWRLWNYHSIKCAMVAGEAPSDNNWALVQYECLSHSPQFWHIAES